MAFAFEEVYISENNTRNPILTINKIYMKTPSPVEVAAYKLMMSEIERLGSQIAFARQLSVTQQCVQNWVRRGYVPGSVVVRHPEIFLMRSASTSRSAEGVSVTVVSARGV